MTNAIYAGPPRVDYKAAAIQRTQERIGHIKISFIRGYTGIWQTQQELLALGVPTLDCNRFLLESMRIRP